MEGGEVTAPERCDCAQCQQGGMCKRVAADWRAFRAAGMAAHDRLVRVSREQARVEFERLKAKIGVKP